MKKIHFMDTSLRDGFQSVFGARTLTDDFLSAVEALVEAGLHHLEAVGGARFQSLFMYCVESAFSMMDWFRKAAGLDARLQTLARGGFGKSVTPVSQFYFQQAYANVTQGPWKKITGGYRKTIIIVNRVEAAVNKIRASGKLDQIIQKHMAVERTSHPRPKPLIVEINL